MAVHSSKPRPEPDDGLPAVGHADARDLHAELQMTLAGDALASLSICITVLDHDGVVLWRNAQPDAPDHQHDDWPQDFPETGGNYLAAYRIAVAQGDRNAMRAFAGILAVVHGRTSDYRLEYPCYRPRGLRWFSLHVLPLAGGRGVVVTHEDISERKRRDHEQVCRRALLSRYRQSDIRPGPCSGDAGTAGARAPGAVHSARLQEDAAAVFTDSSEAMAIIDCNRRIVLVNRAFCDSSGFNGSEVVGRAFAAFYCDDHRPDACDAIWRCLDIDGKWRGHVRARRKDGQTYPVLLTINCVFSGQGTIRNYVSTAIDISTIRDAPGRPLVLARNEP